LIWPHPSVLLAASTRDDEETMILEAWRNRPAGLANALLLIVPRHPQRFERVVDLARQARLRVARRSETTQLDADTDCWIGDSLGEMAAYIAASDLALMGGSLIAGGGQNPIEVCAQGRPVFFGPHMFNFQSISRDLVRAGAGYEVASAEAWVARAATLLEKPKDFEAARGAARSYVASHQGSSERTHQALWQRYFSSSSGPVPESDR
jgi:3-deoxy-D-manno-octulosonic-acid transferase